MTFSLAACAEMIFTDLPFLDRVQRIHDAGFGVEMWDWSTKDLPAIAATGIGINSMTGYLTGSLVDPDGAAEFLRTAALSLEAADIIDCPNMNVHGTGLGPGGLPVIPHVVVTPADWLAAARTLDRLAALGEKHGRVFNLENLNLAVDHPGVPFARAEDVLTLVSAVDNPHLRINLDLYHAQIGEGNLVELCERALPWIGEVQVADVPGRCEPGTGEIHYPRVARALTELGYSGVVAMEAFAADDPDVALARFREAFAV